MAEPQSRTGRGLAALAVCLFLAAVAGHAWVPQWDADFWWHIATGKVIATEGTVPVRDPFGVYQTSDPIREGAYMRSQWLGQLLLFWLHGLGGVTMVIASRTAVLVLGSAAILLRCRLLGVGRPSMWLVGLVGAANLVEFTGERPQLFSYFCAAALFVLIDLAWRRASWRWLTPLPLVALVWANCHGGFILGVVLLVLVAIGRLIGSRPDERKTVAAFVGFALAFALMTLVTPGGAGTYDYLLQLEGSVLQERTSEYASALKLYAMGAWGLQGWVWAWYLLAALSLVGLFRRSQLDRLLVVAFLAAITASAYRYHAFFVLLAAPYVARGLGRLEDRLPLPRSPKWVDGLAALCAAAALAWGLLWGTAFTGGLKPRRFPVAAVRELTASGRAFNHMDWGGYLLWHAPSQIVPWVDGRMLDTNRLVQYTHVLWATPEGVRWFNEADFDLVVMPEGNRFTGEAYALPKLLRRSPAWRLTYQDDVALVFVRQR